MNACDTYRGIDEIVMLVRDWWPTSPIRDPSRAKTSDDWTGWVICHTSPVPWADAAVAMTQNRAERRIGLGIPIRPVKDTGAPRARRSCPGLPSWAILRPWFQ